MNQLFLKDLADKTRRGLRGRVEAGKSGGGNSFGYDVVRRALPDGSFATGERRVNPQEAAIVLRKPVNPQEAAIVLRSSTPTPPAPRPRRSPRV